MIKPAVEKPAFWSIAGITDYLRANKVILLLSVIICLLVSVIIQLRRNPVYRIDSVIGLAGRASLPSTAFLQEASQMKRETKNVLQKALRQSPLLVRYEIADGEKAHELYAADAPVKVEVLRILPEAYGRKVTLTLFDDGTAEVNGLGKAGKYDINSVIYTASADFRIVPNKEIYAQKKLLITFNNPDNLAATYARKLNIKPDAGKKQITISLTESHPQKGVDLLKRVNRVYAGMRVKNGSEKKLMTVRDSISRVKQELKQIRSAAAEKVVVKEAPKKTVVKSDKQQKQTLAVLSDYLDRPFENFTLLPAYDTKDRFLNDAIEQFNNTQQKRTVAENKEPFDAELRVMRQKMIARIRNISQIQTPAVRQGTPLRLARTDERLTRAKEAVLAALSHKEDSLKSLAVSPAVEIIKAPTIRKAGTVFQATLLYLGAVLLGLVLPMPIVYARNTFTKNILSLRDVQAISSLPVAGVISHHPEPTENTGSAAVDYVRYKNEWSLLTAPVIESKKSKTGMVIALTSTESGEGKSYLAQHLSLMLAQKDQRVVFVDLNIIDNDHKQKPGVINFIIQNELDVETLLQVSAKSDNLFFISSGFDEKKQVHNDLPFYQWEVGKKERDRIRSPRIKQLLTELRKNFDFVVLDTPSVLHDPYADEVYPLADMRLHVLRYNHTRKAALKQLSLSEREAKKTRLILNDMRQTPSHFYKSFHQN